MVNLGKAIRQDQSRIEAAVSEAEAGTCGEIIVAFARRAGHYEREEAIVALVFALGLFTLGWLGLQRVVPMGWSETPTPRFGLGWSLIALITGYALGILICRAFRSIPMLLVGRHRRLRAAEEAAILAFHDLHASTTRAHTGVILLLAEAERSVVVLGDAPISRHISEEEWKSVRDTMLGCIRQKQPVDGIIAAVGEAGKLLATHFPPHAHDRDELPNGVYFIV